MERFTGSGNVPATVHVVATPKATAILSVRQCVSHDERHCQWRSQTETRALVERLVELHRHSWMQH